MLRGTEPGSQHQRFQLLLIYCFLIAVTIHFHQNGELYVQDKK